MIHRTYREPNFRCKVHDSDGNVYDWLTYAASEVALRRRLQGQGLTVDDIQPYDFTLWKARAASERQKAIDAHDHGETPDFKSEVWSQLKLHLFDLFAGKCAYCESRVLHVASGDVEHYRPKKPPEEDQSHPGYYWLAYDVGNLLPCCEKCNRVRGKRRCFPVAGQRACSPRYDLEAEQPLILSPYRDWPQEHLAFLPGMITPEGDLVCVGTVEGITDQGSKTVELCNLRRADLVEERKREQEHFVNDVLLAASRLKPSKVVSLWCEALAGERPYSAAVLAQRSVLEQVGVVCPPVAMNLTAVGGGGSGS